MLVTLGAPKVRPSSAVKYIVDGNSIYSDNPTSPPMATLLAETAYLTGTGTSVVHCAIGGQTWRQMNGLDGGSSSDVDSAMDTAKTCVLICSEGTNSIGNAGRTAAQAKTDATNYIAARRAAWVSAGGVAKKFKVVLCTALPRNGNGDSVAVAVDAYHALCVAGWREMGADVFVDYRTGTSPFNHSGMNPEPFAANQTLWHETSGWLHPTNTGRAVMVQMIEAGLRRLRA